MPTEKRTYTESHPWLTFSVDRGRADYRLWLLLGEATSKTQHLERALLRPDVARELLRVYLVKGAVATTAIEGNTLSEDQAVALLDDKLRLPPSQAYLGREVRNVIDAFDQITERMMQAELREEVAPPLTVDAIRDYNRLVLNELELEDGVAPGDIPDHSVVVGGYRGAPRQDCEYLLQRLCDWLGSGDFDAPATQPELHWPLSLVKACIAHLYLAWIHPFGDGNGRTARLLELHILLAEGFPVPSAQLLSNHYNKTRERYYRQLAASSRDSDPLAFVLYGVEGYVDEVRGQLDRIWSMQYLDRWEQYVYEQFGEISTDVQRRRLRLIKDVSDASISTNEGQSLPDIEVVAARSLRRLTPELVELYAGKTDKTVSRDVLELETMGLLVRVGGGVIPNSDAVLGFMPSAFRQRSNDEAS